MKKRIRRFYLSAVLTLTGILLILTLMFIQKDFLSLSPGEKIEPYFSDETDYNWLDLEQTPENKNEYSLIYQEIEKEIKLRPGEQKFTGVLEAIYGDPEELFEEKDGIFHGFYKYYLYDFEKNKRHEIITDEEERDISLLDSISPGREIEIIGTMNGEKIILSGYSPRILESDEKSLITGRPISSSAVSPLGKQRVLVVLVNFAQNPTSPFTVTETERRIFSTTVNYPTANKFIRENSYNRTWLEGAVRGWHTLSGINDCDIDLILEKSVQAVDPQINFNNYDRMIIIFPNLQCSAGGWGSIGSRYVQTNDGLWSGSVAWIPFNQGLEEKWVTINHELGHNFGLKHSNYQECITTWSNNCYTMEYLDPFDTMGYSRGHFNAAQKHVLGWLSSSEVKKITTGGTYNYYIYPLSSNPGTAKAIRIPLMKTSSNLDYASQQNEYLYIHYRRPTGFDAHILDSGSANNFNGVFIHSIRFNGNNFVNWGSTYAFDTSPHLENVNLPILQNGFYADLRNMVLRPGMEVSVLYYPIKIKTISVNDEWAHVQITIPTKECNDGVDNDGDGKKDFPADKRCKYFTFNTESGSDYPSCNDGIDNDRDGRTDSGDYSCLADSLRGESAILSRCQNWIDDDNDLKVDYFDNGCMYPNDNSE